MNQLAESLRSLANGEAPFVKVKFDELRSEVKRNVDTGDIVQTTFDPTSFIGTLSQHSSIFECGVDLRYNLPNYIDYLDIEDDVPDPSWIGNQSGTTQPAKITDVNPVTDKKTLTFSRAAITVKVDNYSIQNSPTQLEYLFKKEFASGAARALENALLRPSITNGPIGIVDTNGIHYSSGSTNGAALTLTHVKELFEGIVTNNGVFNFEIV